MGVRQPGSQEQERVMPKAMAKVVTIGLDIAKDVFQVHGIDKAGAVVLRRKLRRSEMTDYFKKLKPCLIGMEACGTSHFWARTLHGLGHEVKIMHAKYVKPFVKTNKNDAADAEAICEAVQRATMRFVPIKTEGQQAVLVLHRTRDLLARQRTSLINAFRSHLAEYGVIASIGLSGTLSLMRGLKAKKMPPLARVAIEMLVGQIRAIEQKTKEIDRQLRIWHRASAQSMRLATIPGIGFLAATMMAASVPDPRVFRNGRSMAAWLGLVPKQFSTAGKTTLGGISKKGNNRLRSLLYIGARNVITTYQKRGGKVSRWVAGLVRRKAEKVARIALANKIARVAWALMANKENFKMGRAVSFAR